MEKQQCLHCGTEVPQKEGRRQRKFCDNNGKCRVAYFHKTHPKEKKYVLKERYEELKLEYHKVLTRLHSCLTAAAEQEIKPQKAAKKPAKKDRLPVAVDRMLQDIPVEDRPVREKGESGFTYSMRLAEWKDKQKADK